MNILLRYDAVCFAWNEQRLYLGSLGPCADGAEPYEAWLTGYLNIHLAIPSDDGTRFPAVIDSGAYDTNCSSAFLDANGGRLGFSFGEDAELVSECVIDNSVLFPGLEYGYDQVAIRTKTLLQFRAFGWQINPLRVYFLPEETNLKAKSDRRDG